MRKTLSMIISSQRNRLGILAAVALAGSLGLHGCTTNPPPEYGQPAMSAPAAGSFAPNAASTPGSAQTMGSMPLGPNGMISSLPASGDSIAVDAIATEKADAAFQGKVLGPAPLGDNSVMPASMQQVTGQFISPSLYANPQITVNSSISSPPTPAIISGAGEPVGGAAVAVVPATSGIVAGTALPAIAGTTAAVPGAAVTAGAVLNGVQNVGVTGMSNTTATPITNTNIANTATATVPATAATPVVNTGIAVAPGVASNVVATPILSTVGPGVLATNAGGSVLGVTNVTATPAAAMPTVTTTSTTAPVTLGVGVVGNGMATPTFTAGQVNAPTTLQTGAVTATAASTARTRAVNRATTTAGVRVVTTSNGAVVITNQSPSVLNRFLSLFGLRRNLTANGTSGSARQ